MGDDGGRSLDAEREYLEDLLTKRFNFYIVFVGAVAAGIYQIEEPIIQGISLIIGAGFSMFFAGALTRTHALVSAIICETVKKHEKHPLRIARQKVRGRTMINQDANTFFGVHIPALLTLTFFVAGVYVLGSGSSI